MSGIYPILLINSDPELPIFAKYLQDSADKKCSPATHSSCLFEVPIFRVPFMRCFKSPILGVLLSTLLLTGCREEYYVIAPSPERGDSTTLFADSEIGPLAIDLHFPVDRENTIGKARFLLTLEIEDGKIQSVSAKADEVSAFIPQSVVEYKGWRILVTLQENPSYPYRRQLQDQDVSEEELSNLPLGHIIIDDKDWSLLAVYSRCTGFLVSPSLVVTNNHCVADKSDCSRTKIKVWNYKEGWMKRNLDTSTYQCKEILYTDAERDQTLFRIEGNASFYSKFPIARRAMSLEKDEIFRISTMDEGFFMGRIHREHKKCVLKNDEGLQRSIDGKKYLDAICDKDINMGNSGSPVFDSEGYVFGVLWGKAIVSERTAIFAPLNPTIMRLILEENR